MPTKREQVLAALAARLGAIDGPSVRRNEGLPARIPDGGLIIVHDGDPGEPEVTLNPRSEYYSHRIPVEVILTGDRSTLDDLLIAIGLALVGDDTLGGLVERLVIPSPDVGVTPVEGAATLRHATVSVLVEYLVSGILDEA